MDVTDSRLAQSYEVFAILMGSRSFPRKKSGDWEERDEECSMEKHVEQPSIFKRVVSFHVLALAQVALLGWPTRLAGTCSRAISWRVRSKNEIQDLQS